MTLRILIVDDHPVVRRGLKEMLDKEPGLDVVAQATNAREAVAAARKIEWDVAVVDYGLPGKDGITLIKELRRRHPGRPVLMLSLYPESQFAMRALKAGAAGYLAKESAPETLVGAIHAAACGRKYVSPVVADMLANGLGNTDERQPHELLSDREFQIMTMLAEGKKVAEVGKLLSLSPSTVGTYRTLILRKMGVSNSAELVRYAMRHDLIAWGSASVAVE